ncbi:hypothetical protein A7976_00965 [Methylobacillus sp. MM3]|uniref:DUF2004 domain-containing protein n=1 Tax=Methylobacillus sp. MM3 TaxID=1848039 RepID=UPI0007DFCA54|nr:DUF2004 domain-containing protein [Methylobacillus sp. MM3]OAJ70239.1 hypothetical protein A7976_00965 [Methylobacillus sp. MM3]
MTIVESEKRQKLALEAIKQAFGTESGEDNVNLFVEHHIEELPQNYWQQYLGGDTPEPAAVVDLLQLRSSWGQNDIEYFDFTLPGEVTDYVVSVHFDSSGDVDGVSMES